MSAAAHLERARRLYAAVLRVPEADVTARLVSGEGAFCAELRGPDPGAYSSVAASTEAGAARQLARLVRAEAEGRPDLVDAIAAFDQGEP